MFSVQRCREIVRTCTHSVHAQSIGLLLGRIPVYDCEKSNSIAIMSINPARALIGQKPMFYQSIKHRKSVFYCFARVKSIF